jgi:hypothetical protein
MIRRVGRTLIAQENLMTRTTRTSLLGASALALLAVAAVVWMRPASQPVPASPDATGLPPGTAAMRANLNPETGALTVGAGEIELALDADTREALRRDAEGLKETLHENGAVSIHLQGRFQSASIAHLDENGVVSICSDHADHAERALNQAAPARETAPEVK